MKQPTVFISYSHSDKKFVDMLSEKLTNSGVNVWIDKWMIKIGDSISQKIEEGINSSDFLVIVLSNSSVESKWVREELSAATIKNIEAKKHAYILPVLIEDCTIPPLIRHRKYADFTKDYNNGYNEILEVIRPDIIKTKLEIEPEMVLIPAGTFIMGSDPEKDELAVDYEQPQHTLYLDDFYISKYPITNKQYIAFVDENEISFPWD